MSDRELPELRSRLRIDTSDVDKAKREIEAVSRLRPAGDGVSSAIVGPLERNSARLQKFGRDATLYATVPLVAAGAASIKLGTDFDSTFTRMTTLAGVAGDEVAGLKEEVLKLAGETGRSPQELAAALELIRSAGITGSTALDVLKMSAEGAAIGLGDTRTVADAVSSAVNTYGAGVLSAGQATDILAASVKVAKVEASSMAPEFGRLLPVASQLDVSFAQVGGALAFLTQGGGSASEAATRLEGILQKLLRPSAMAEETLNSVGLSGAKLRQVVKEQGLVAALQLLDDKLGGNSEKLGKVFEDSQAVVGALALLRDGGKPAADALGEVADSAGMVGEGFDSWSKTDPAKTAKATAEVQAEMIKMGQELLPLLADIVGHVADIGEAFLSLPAPIRNGLLAIVTLAGPVASALGKIGGNVKMLHDVAKRGSDALTGLSTAGTAAAGAGALIAAGLVVAASAFQHARDEARQLQASIKDLRDEADSSGKSFEEVTRTRLAAFIAGEDLPDLDERGLPGILRRLRVDASETGDALTGSEAQYRSFREELKQKIATDLGSGHSAVQAAESQLRALDGLRGALGGAIEQDRVYKAALADQGIQMDDNTAATDDNTTSTSANADAIDIATQSRVDSLLAVRAQIDAVVQLAESHLSEADAQRSADDAVAAYRDGLKAAAGDSDEMRRAVEAETAAERDVATAQKDGRDAQIALNDARASAAERLQDLQFAAEGAAIAEERAQLRLADAKARLDEVNADPRSTDTQRRSAELDVQEADLASRQATDANSDSQKELTSAQAKGIEQSDEVVAARQRVADASDRVTEANKRLRDAEADVRRIQADAAKKLPALADKAKEAMLDLFKASLAADGSIQSAVKRLGDMANALMPSGPLRRWLRDFLSAVGGTGVVSPRTMPVPVTEVDPGDDPPSSGGTGGRHRWGSKVVVPRSLVAAGVGALSAPAAPAGPGGGVMVAKGAYQHTTVVQGEPDAVLVAKLERRTEEAARRGLDETFRGLG